MAEDYYKTLGISRDASQADIQKAYRDLARKYHPDMNPDKSAKQQFQKVQTAFDVLNDTSKRELYDRYGSSFESMGAGQPRGGPSPGGGRAGQGFQGFEDVDFSQFFGDRYGGSSDPSGGFADIFSHFRRAGGEPRGPTARPGPRQRGGDIRSELEIPFQTSVIGGEAALSVTRPSGKVETITVKIPAGVEDGKEIRLRGQGAESETSTQRGDIRLTLRVAAHPWFQRRGDDLQVRVPVTLAEAATGAKVDVPTPHGVVTVRIPAGTSSGTKLRVKGQGVKAKGRPPGNLFAEVQIMLPKELDRESLEAIQKIEERYPLDPRRDLRW